jgi:hypothetical protein
MDSSNPPNNNSTAHEETDGVTYEAIHSERTNAGRNRDSISTVTSEKEASSSDKFHENGVSNVSGGVNVSRAEAEFAELSKELSRASNLSRKISRVQSRQSRKNEVPADVEKAIEESDASSEEQFDLESVLRGNRDEEERAGIKSKHIGVVWENLTVSGIGGVRNIVKVSTVSPDVQHHTGANIYPRHFQTRSFRSSTSLKPYRLSLDLARRAESSIS